MLIVDVSVVMKSDTIAVFGDGHVVFEGVFPQVERRGMLPSFRQFLEHAAT